MKKYIASAAFTILIISTLASCATPPTTSEPSISDAEKADATQNTTPKKGWVKVYNDKEGDLADIEIYKRCDGGNLIYLTPGNNSGAHGISIITGSPECYPN